MVEFALINPYSCVSYLYCEFICVGFVGRDPYFSFDSEFDSVLDQVDQHLFESVFVVENLKIGTFRIVDIEFEAFLLQKELKKVFHVFQRVF